MFQQFYYEKENQYFQIHPTIGDGSCMVQSVCGALKFLQIKDASPCTKDELQNARKAVVLFLQQHKNTFYETWNAGSAHLGKENSYEDHVSILQK